MLIERVEQGVPLESLDLSACDEPCPSSRAEQILAEIVVDVQGRLGFSWTMDVSENHAGTGSRKEVEYDNDWDHEPWYGLYCEEEYVNDYVGFFDGIDFDNFRVEYDSNDGLPIEWDY